MGKFNANSYNNFHGNKQNNNNISIAVHQPIHQPYHQIQQQEEHQQQMNSMKIVCKNVIDLDKEKLVYRAEGNANLVLSLPNSKKVLRLRKTLLDQIDINDKTLTDKNLALSVEYIKLISCLFGHLYTYQPEIVTLKINSYDSLNQWINLYRPADRLDKTVNCKSGILYPDATFLPDNLLFSNGYNHAYFENLMNDTYSIEIKPKQGWSFFSNEFTNYLNILDLDGIDKCRFCCMQYLKLAKGKTKEISGFCPLDLFSGVPSRIKLAINELIKSPQNNFRILKNGNLIYDSKTDINQMPAILRDLFQSTDTYELNHGHFINLLMEILLHDFSKCQGKLSSNIYAINDTQINQRSNICKESIESNLPDNCILQKILDIQKLAKSSLGKLEIFNENECEPYSYIETMLEKFLSFKNDLNSSNFFELLNNQERYLLGATALDCSIMITFRLLSSTNNDCILSSSSSSEYKFNLNHILTIMNKYKILANVCVMDLDPKSSNHHSKYIKQTNASHAAYRNSI